MSDLSATNCGCNGGSGREGNNGCSNLIWLLILLSLFNNNDGCGSGRGGFGLFNNNGDNGCCNLIIWLLLLSTCCGNGSIF